MKPSPSFVDYATSEQLSDDDVYSIDQVIAHLHLVDWDMKREDAPRKLSISKPNPAS